MNSRITKYLNQNVEQGELATMEKLDALLAEIDDPDTKDRILMWICMKYGDRLSVQFDDDVEEA